MILERLDEIACLRAPYLHGPVARSRDDVAARQRDGIHGCTVVFHAELAPEVRQQVRAYRPVLRAGHKPIIVEAHTEHAVRVVAYNADRIAACEIPDDDLPVAPAAREKAVVCAYTQHAAFVHAFDDASESSRADIPLADAPVFRTCEEDLSASIGVGVEL